VLVQDVKQLEQTYYDSVHVISHSEKTVATYRSSINHLRTFLSETFDIDELELKSKIDSNELDVYKVINQFIIYLDKRGLKAKGIRSYLSGVKGYLRFTGIKISSDDFRLLVKIPKVIKTQEVPITKKHILQILRNANPKLQTAVLVASASGLRLGELVQLRLSDIDFTVTPATILVRANTSKSKMARQTFLTEEATKSLQDYLKKNFGWHENSLNLDISSVYIFGRTSVAKSGEIPRFSLNSAKQSLHVSLKNHCEKIPELSVKNENGRKAIHFHAFRKYFRTTVGNVCGRDYAEALMGHGFYMDTYYQLSSEDKHQKYLSAEPYLTISDFEKVEQQYTDLSEKYEEMEKTMDELKRYLSSNSISVPESLK
jgi:integrase